MIFKHEFLIKDTMKAPSVPSVKWRLNWKCCLDTFIYLRYNNGSLGISSGQVIVLSWCFRRWHCCSAGEMNSGCLVQSFNFTSCVRCCRAALCDWLVAGLSSALADFGLSSTLLHLVMILRSPLSCSHKDTCSFLHCICFLNSMTEMSLKCVYFEACIIHAIQYNKRLGKNLSAISANTFILWTLRNHCTHLQFPPPPINLP